MDIADKESLSLVADGVIGADEDGTILFFSPAAEQIFGYAEHDLIGRHMDVLLPARSRGSHRFFVSKFVSAAGDEKRLMAERTEVRGLHRDGNEFPATVSISRRRVEGRTILTALVRDITDRKKLEAEVNIRNAQLEESNHRLKLAMRGGGLGAWEWDRRRATLLLDPKAQSLLEVDGQDVLVLRELLERTVPGDADEVATGFGKAAHRGTLELEFGLLLRDGTRRQIALTGQESGQRIFGVARDVTQRWRSQQQQQVLVGETNHRIANLIAVVQSVVRLTTPHFGSAEELCDALQGRLSAVGERQRLLNEEGWSSVGLDSLLTAELRPYAAPGAGNLVLEGPPLRLSPNAATSLGLLIHELATNAAKYGALSSASGRLSVTWHVDDERDDLELRWVERGGPKVHPQRDKALAAVFCTAR